tara:strand:+ start:4135 stop:5088 length:954 start_codon:yes stop_codon:yes gene_type:complete
MKKIQITAFIIFVFLIFLAIGQISKINQANLQRVIDRENSMNFFSDTNGKNCFGGTYIDLSSVSKRFFGKYSLSAVEIGFYNTDTYHSFRTHLGVKNKKSFFCPNPPKQKLIYKCDYLSFLDNFEVGHYKDKDYEDIPEGEIIDNFATFLEITPFDDQGVEDIFVEVKLISVLSPGASLQLDYQSDLVTIFNRKLIGLISGATNKERKFINFGNNEDLRLFIDRINLSISGRDKRPYGNAVSKTHYAFGKTFTTNSRATYPLETSQCIAIDEENFIPNLMQTADKIETLLTSFRQSERLKHNQLNEKDKKLKDDFQL